MKDINKKLAVKIFGKLCELAPEEKEFIDYQAKQFAEYKKAIAEKFREAENKKKLSTLEYEAIEYLFFQRVHPQDVLKGIENGVEVGRERGMAIYSAGFFKPHIYALYQKRKKEISNRTLKIIPNLDWPWFFLLYKMDRTGELKEWIGPKAGFDPYYGYIYK